MAQYEGYSSDVEYGAAKGEIHTWAVGFIFLGSMLMVLLGSFHIVQGLAALLQDDFFRVREHFDLRMDVTVWGWLQILLGIVLMVTGIALWTSSTLARVVAIGLTALAALWNFYSIPYYPAWSILMFAMCIAVLWALIAHGRELQDMLSDENSLTS